MSKNLDVCSTSELEEYLIRLTDEFTTNEEKLVEMYEYLIEISEEVMSVKEIIEKRGGKI